MFFLDEDGTQRSLPTSWTSAAEPDPSRNFEGRQGKGGRTHLVSPEMAAAAAITGHLVDVRELDVQREGD